MKDLARQKCRKSASESRPKRGAEEVAKQVLGAFNGATFRELQARPNLHLAQEPNGWTKTITLTFEIITCLIQKHFKTAMVTVIFGKWTQMIFKMVIGNQGKWGCDCGRQDGNGNGN